MPTVCEGLFLYELTPMEASRLEDMNLIVEEDTPGLYATTALLWDDLGIEGDKVALLFDAILGRPNPEVRCVGLVRRNA